MDTQGDSYKVATGVPGWCYTVTAAENNVTTVTRRAQRCEGSSKIVDSVIAKTSEASSLGSLFCTKCRMFVCNICLPDSCLQVACPACSVNKLAEDAKKLSALSRVLRCSGHGVCSKDLTDFFVSAVAVKRVQACLFPSRWVNHRELYIGLGFVSFFAVEFLFIFLRKVCQYL